MKALKKTGKILAIAAASILALFVLVIVGLNLVKFGLYSEYYSEKTDLCINPGLGDGFVCQGIAAVDGEDLILVSGYMKGDEASRVYVTTLDNQAYYVTLSSNGEPFDGHAGGIASSGDYVYIGTDSRIFTISLETLLSARNGDVVDIGPGTEINNSAAFLYCDDQYLYVGSFYNDKYKKVEDHIFETAEGTHYAICSKYAIGDLTTPVAVYSIRDQVQGICFTPEGKVIMSTSYGLADSHYYQYELEDAVDSGKTLDGAKVYYLDQVEETVKGPAMAEGLDLYRGEIITLTESASDKYIFGKFFFANKIVSLDIGD